MKKIERTQGDGIDNAALNETNHLESLRNTFSASQRSMKILNSLRPVEPKSKVIYLTPKHTSSTKSAPNYFVQKPKEPKFVPCEPYKAAVEPLSTGKKNNNKIPKRMGRNDMELQNLVVQLSETRKIEMNKLNINEQVDDINHNKLLLAWKKEKEQYEVDLQNLRSSNTLLENQLKFQAQVNSELKTLLVAAVGEDLENRVQHLTEDKLSLARALLNSANHLTSHQEQTEWLSGQCEVWRSKFLASSLMVEELAKWKSALSNRTNELLEVIKTLLTERKKIHSQLAELMNNLDDINKHICKENYQQPVLKYGNILEVTNVCLELTKILSTNLGAKTNERMAMLNNLQPTVAEKTAERLLNNPISISNKPDLLCNAVIGAASSLGNEQMFLQYPSLHSCCSHCTGELQTI
ncbi:golgin-45 [Diorhabda sublineata]|uniref:golgin-45 n=1 Tax=Diorhabda sublineata TaxID=1163346 RepID=UPI0024E18D33|nr:golgin-45 [Diorhabda sublineata]